jgi:hypothetical protein
MKASARKIDGYVVQNTKHVLCALRAYELKASGSNDAVATQAAIDCYAALSQRRVVGRSVRRWLAVVKSYGGTEKTPENAFGALKSCPHVARPIRDRLRQIVAEIERLSRDLNTGNLIDPQIAMELALIDRDMDSCAASVYGPIRYRLAAIRRNARRVAGLSAQRLHQFAAEPDLGSSLAGILARLKATAPQRAGRPV